MKGIKLFGLTALVALALTAVLGVTSASALKWTVNNHSETVFRANSYPAKIQGTQLAPAPNGHEIVTPKALTIGTASGQLKCSTFTFSDPPFAPEGILGDTEMLWLKRTLENCTLAGLKATVAQDAECLNTFNVGGAFAGQFALCGLTLTVPSSKCKITFPSQTRSGMTFQNAKWSVTEEAFYQDEGVIAKANITGLEYKIESTQCPNPGPEGTHTDGTYKGNIGLSEF